MLTLTLDVNGILPVSRFGFWKYFSCSIIKKTKSIVGFMGIRVEPLCVITPLRGYQPLRPNLVVILSTLLSDHPFRGHISLQTNWRFLEKASVVLKAHSHVTSVFALLFDLCCTVLENANIKHTRSQSKNLLKLV